MQKLRVGSVAALQGVANNKARDSFGVVSIYTTAGLFILAIALGNISALAAIGGKVWLYLALSGLAGIALGHAPFYAAIDRIGPTIPTVLLLSQLFTVLLLSHAFFDEKMNMIWAGFGTILLAGAAMTVLSRKQDPS